MFLFVIFFLNCSLGNHENNKTPNYNQTVCKLSFKIKELQLNFSSYSSYLVKVNFVYLFMFDSWLEIEQGCSMPAISRLEVDQHE